MNKLFLFFSDFNLTNKSCINQLDAMNLICNQSVDAEYKVIIKYKGNQSSSLYKLINEDYSQLDCFISDSDNDIQEFLDNNSFSKIIFFEKFIEINVRWFLENEKKILSDSFDSSVVCLGIKIFQNYSSSKVGKFIADFFSPKVYILDRYSLDIISQCKKDHNDFLKSNLILRSSRFEVLGYVECKKELCKSYLNLPFIIANFYIAALKIFRRLKNLSIKLLQYITSIFVGMDIKAGPYKGIRISLAYGSSHTPKIFGTYESEIQPYFQNYAKNFLKFIDYGCADGFYLLAYKHINKNGEAVGYDISDEAIKRARKACEETKNCTVIKANGNFSELLCEDSSLIMIDCEGFEYDLLLDNDLNELSKAALIIEDHYFITGHPRYKLASKLMKKHDVKIIFASDNSNFLERDLRHPEAQFLICSPKENCSLAAS